MDPITIGLIATSALGKLGSILGGKKRTQIDPAELERLFGAKAISAEQTQLFNRAMGSAQGQQLMTNAAQQGQQLQTDVARGAAEAGLGGGSGASGGADIFAGAASQSAQGNLQRSMQSNLMSQMLPIAQSLVGDRMNAWLKDRDAMYGQTTKFQDVMGAVGGLSSDLLSAREQGQANASPSSMSFGGPGSDNGNPGQFIGPPMPPTVNMGQAGQAPPASGSAMTAQPAGAMAAPTSVTPSAQATGAPAGAAPMTGAPSKLAMPNALVQSNTPGMRDQQNRLFMSGGGRFARAMSARNRFGAVQSAF